MNNRNETFRWVTDEVNNKIKVSKEILTYQNPIRGVYGIFKCLDGELDECIYVGRADNIYSRLFSGKGHLVKLMKDLKSSILKDTYLDEKAIIKIEVLEVVKLQFDNYNLDIQRLASRENFYIDSYQSKNQCLLQRPEGSHLRKEFWDKKKMENESLK